MEGELQQLIEKLEPLDGPFIILGRPHSGTRSLAHAFFQQRDLYGKTHLTRVSGQLGLVSSSLCYRSSTAPIFPLGLTCRIARRFAASTNNTYLSPFNPMYRKNPSRRMLGVGN